MGATSLSPKANLGERAGSRSPYRVDSSEGRFGAGKESAECNRIQPSLTQTVKCRLRPDQQKVGGPFALYYTAKTEGGGVLGEGSSLWFSGTLRCNT